MTRVAAVPTSDMDFYGDAAIDDPYPHYRTLRDLGPAVWLPRNGAWAIARYKEVRDGLKNAEVFSSAHGCMLNEPINTATSGGMLCSDDPLHMELRRVFSEPLLPGALTALKEQITVEADRLIERLAAQRQFDAVRDLAHYLPVTIVADLVGLDAEGRANMLKWASGIFDAFGNLPNPRTEAGLAVTAQAVEWMQTRITRDRLRPGGWGDRLQRAADQGRLSRAHATAMLLDYLTPALDTTINATSSAIWLLGSHPEQWDILRADPALIPDAISEVLRYESPIRAFARYVTRDHDLDEVTIPEKSRALLIYASANRDERKWPDADRFDVRRKPVDQLAFGHGSHACPGMHLARIEIAALLEALVRRVQRFELGAATRVTHNTLRGLQHLQVTVH